MSIKMSQKELDVLAIIFHSESPMTRIYFKHR